LAHGVVAELDVLPFGGMGAGLFLALEQATNAGCLERRMEHMEDLAEHMAEIELTRFSVNGYRGLPDAPAFSIVEGSLPVVVSAPHAVTQLREGRVKPSDDFTGAMALVVAELSGANAIVASRYDACDPNWDSFDRCAYKQALADTVRETGAVALLDLHGVPAAAPDALEVGSADGRTVQALPGADEFARRFLSERLQEHLQRRGKAVGLNARHAARGPNTVANAIARECGIAALQIEISSPFRVPLNVKGHVPPGESVPFTNDQLPLELAARRNPDPTCVEETVRALADLVRILASDTNRASAFTCR